MKYVPAIPFAPEAAPEWGSSGETVYTRTYQRTKPNGDKETWAETVDRVVRGNLSLVDPKHIDPHEYADLCDMIYNFKIMPAGRHLWASGVEGRQYLFNCHVAGWEPGSLSEHFRFTFLRLMEGGGVGSNYSGRFLKQYGTPKRSLKVHIVCDPSHPDYLEMNTNGVLSDEYSPDFAGAFEVLDSREGWADALTDLIDTYMTTDDVKHLDRVYDVTNVRAKGSRLKTFGGTASGPEPFAVMMNTVNTVMNDAHNDWVWHYLTPLRAMEIDHAIAECVVSGGNRRSARMSIVEWDDPHVFEFIKCKTDTGKHWTTNISVAYDSEFMRLLGVWESLKGSTDALVIPSPEAIEAKRAGHVHDAVVNGMLTNGEPGYWNRSLSQVGETGEVIATNPCGEITLEAWENCNLGHVNLSKFLHVGQQGSIDYRVFKAHRLMARFLIRATYGDVNDPKQAAKLALNRRIGVGHFGVQSFLAQLGVRYSNAVTGQTVHGSMDMPEFLRTCYSEVRAEADRYAFALRIPAPVKVTTVAPTGTIAKLSGDTEGIHPVYARHFIRRIRFAMTDLDQVKQVAEFRAKGYHTEKCEYDKSGNTMVVEIPTQESLVTKVIQRGHPVTVIEAADELLPNTMLMFQEMYQHWYADNAVSFTLNVPEGKYDPAEFGKTLKTYMPLLKGTTVMPDGTRPQAPYERISETDYLLYQNGTEADSVDEDCATGACPVR